MEGLAAIVETVLRRLGIYRHSANRIARGGLVMRVVMAGVTAMFPTAGFRIV